MSPYASDSKTGPLEPLSESANDFDRALLWAGFGLRAVRRRRAQVLAVFLGTLAVVFVALAVMPRTYRVQTRLLTHRSYVIPALVSPHRTVPVQADTPTGGAVELIKSRENLLGVIEEADLLRRWRETRSPVGRAKDWLRDLVLGPLPADEYREAVLATLEERFLAYVEGEVVVMQIDWHNPDDAVRLATVAQERFLRARKEAELGEVNETVRILSRSLVSSRTALEQAMADLQALIAEKTSSSRRPAQLPTVRLPRSSGPGDDIVDERRRVERELRDVQAEIAILEKEYKDGLSNAKQALMKLRASLGPEHPDIQAAVRVVEERSRPPGNLGKLKAREAELIRELRRVEGEIRIAGRSDADLLESLGMPTQPSSTSRDLEVQDPELESRVRSLQALNERHNDIVERLEEARTEVEVASTAFDYRYIVTVPALQPKRHIKPKIPLVIFGGMAAALFLALLSAVVADVFSRRVVEPWQVQSVAGVPVLGLVKTSDEAASALERV